MKVNALTALSLSLPPIHWGIL